MSTLDELLKPVTRVGKPCIVSRIIAALPDPYNSVVVEMIASDLSGHKITVRLKAAGIKCSYSSIYAHRIGSCGCPSEKA